MSRMAGLLLAQPPEKTAESLAAKAAKAKRWREPHRERAREIAREGYKKWPVRN